MRRRLARIGHSTAVTQTSPSPWAAWGSPHENSAPGHQTGSHRVEPAVRWRVSMLPPPLWGGNADASAGSSGWLPIVPRNGRRRDPDAGRDLHLPRVRRSNVPAHGSGKSSGSRPESRQDRGPAPVPRLQFQDLDPQGVAGIRVLHEHRTRQVIERVEVQRDCCVAVALGDLAVTGHPQVVVDDVARGDPEDRLQPAIPL